MVTDEMEKFKELWNGNLQQNFSSTCSFSKVMRKVIKTIKLLCRMCIPI